MTEAVLNIVLENLSSLIKDEVGLFWGVEKQMQKLCSIFSTIQSVLADAEEKQLTDRPLKDWLRKLKDAAYDVDDILEDFQTESYMLEYKAGGSISSSSKKKFLDALSSWIFQTVYKILLSSRI